MPFVQRVVTPKYVARSTKPSHSRGAVSLPVQDYELEAITNLTLSNALRQLASLVLISNQIFTELNKELASVSERSLGIKQRIDNLSTRVEESDPKQVTVRKYTPSLLIHNSQFRPFYGKTPLLPHSRNLSLFSILRLFVSAFYVLVHFFTSSLSPLRRSIQKISSLHTLLVPLLFVPHSKLQETKKRAATQRNNNTPGRNRIYEFPAVDVCISCSSMGARDGCFWYMFRQSSHSATYNH